MSLFPFRLNEVMRSRYSVTITPHDWRFDAADGTSLLAAARLADIELPASCRNGTCRTCICRLTDGKVRYSIEWPGLSADEKREGYILPCVAIAESDVVIHVPAATPLERA